MIFGIEGRARGIQRLRQRVEAPIGPAVAAFIPQAPEQDRRMMAVAADHPFELGGGGGQPAAAANALPGAQFGKHQDAQAVAGIEKRRRLGIVRQADKIEPHVMNVAGIGFVEDGGHGKTESRPIFVAINPPQGHGDVIDQQSLAAITAEGTQPDRPGPAVKDAFRAPECGINLI
jgi:hypothetical protein